MNIQALTAHNVRLKHPLESKQFVVKYTKGCEESVSDFSTLVSLFKKKGPFAFSVIRFNNPVSTGEGRTRQLDCREMLHLWQEVARTTKV